MHFKEQFIVMTFLILFFSSLLNINNVALNNADKFNCAFEKNKYFIFSNIQSGQEPIKATCNSTINKNETDEPSTSFISGNSHYDCPTLGIHFHYLTPLNEYANSGQMPGMGFDVEAYARNLISTSNFGFFFGGSGTIAWMGKSAKTNIILNTSKSDPGRTYLQSNLGELNVHGKIEMGSGDLKFYTSLFGGLNFHSISQSIESTKTVSGFENSSNNVWSKVAWQYGLELGLRYHFTPGVSLDLRGSYHEVDPLNLANVKESTYNTTSAKYDLNYNTLSPRNISIKIGFLFCIENENCSNSQSMEPTYTPTRSRNRVNLGVPQGGSTPHQIKVPKVNN